MKAYPSEFLKKIAVHMLMITKKVIFTKKNDQVDIDCLYLLKINGVTQSLCWVFPIYILFVSEANLHLAPVCMSVYPNTKILSGQLFLNGWMD